MTKRDVENLILGVLSLINTIGYGTLSHTFFTKLIASADFDTMGFPFTLASDSFTRMIIVNLGTSIATGSSIMIPTGLAWCGIHYNEYLQRLLNQMPEKNHKQKKHHKLEDLSEAFWSFIRSKAKSKEKKPDVKPDSDSDGSDSDRGADPWNNEK